MVDTNFTKIDQILANLEVTEKSFIYDNLAAILHLGNILFESNDNGAQIVESTKKHMTIAAELMKICSEELETAMLNRSIEVAGSQIM